MIRASIVGLGTDEDSLTRVIVTRAEIDMMKVKGEYFNTNKTSLDSAVIGDTSGDYQDFLMALLEQTSKLLHMARILSSIHMNV